MDFEELKVALVLSGWTRKYKILFFTNDTQVAKKEVIPAEVGKAIREVYQQYNTKKLIIYFYRGHPFLLQPYLQRIKDQLEQDKITYELKVL